VNQKAGRIIADTTKTIVNELKILINSFEVSLGYRCKVYIPKNKPDKKRVIYSNFKVRIHGKSGK
jgi:hypothetical protein